MADTGYRGDVLRFLGSDVARLLLFAPAFTPELVALARRRAEVELIDLDRLYHGS